MQIFDAFERIREQSGAERVKDVQRCKNSKYNKNREIMATAKGHIICDCVYTLNSLVKATFVISIWNLFM